MGNCQAIDISTLVIQHPCGRMDKLYWPVTASEIIKTNPGHSVALLLTTTTTATTATAAAHQKKSNSIRVTRIKLLRRTDTLILGQAYRLIPTQEVMQGLWAKKCAEMKKKLGCDFGTPSTRSEVENNNTITNQVIENGGHRRRKTIVSANRFTRPTKTRPWQPSLNSISEAIDDRLPL